MQVYLMMILYWLSLLVILLWWRRLFFVEFGLDFRRRRRFRNWNVFRWRRRFVCRRLIESGLDCGRRDIGSIDWRRFFVESKRHRNAMHRQRSCERRNHLPLRSGFI